MKRQPTIPMYILLLLLGAATTDTSALEILQYPGAVDTWPEDICDGLIVGRYQDDSGDARGFVYDGSTYSTLDFPGSCYTTLNGTDGTNIVGTYYNPASPLRGFLFDGNSFTTIAPPDTATTIFNGAARAASMVRLLSGPITTHPVSEVASYLTVPLIRRLAFPQGGVTRRQISKAAKSSASASGKAPSTDSSMMGRQTLNLFHPDAGPLGTGATGVSGNRVVGYYYQGSPFVMHSFIYEQGEYTTYDVPASLGDDTQIRGIHGDKIVGHYIGTSGAYYGFVATIPEPHTLQLLATVCLSCLVVRRRAICVLGRRCAAYR